jgi:hypothetical protein
MFGKQPKVSLVFAIIDPPSFFGCKLVRHYNCLWSGRNDTQKRIKPGWKSELMREFSLCFGVPQQRNHVSLDKFKEQYFWINVQTVTKDYKQRDLIRGLEYSKVAEILGLTTL